jgi:PAS domain S-box-containing protein
MPAAGISPSPTPPPSHAAGSAPSHPGPWLAAFVTAAIVLVVTATAAFLVHRRLLDAAHARFDVGAARVTANLRRELLVCTQALRATSGLIAAQQLPPGAAPSADSWDRYVTRLALDDTQPCLRTLGYAQVSGNAFTGAPGTPLAHIVLMWPQRGDLAAEQSLGIRPETRDALMHAADTSQVALAVRPAAPDEESAASDSPARVRVDAYYPVYRAAPLSPKPAERRAALDGFIVARIDTEYLFASVAARVPSIALQVATGTPANLLYPPAGAPADLPLSTPYFRRSDTLRFGGQTFALAYSTSDPALTASADFGGSAFLASACLAALLAGAAAYLFLRRRGETLAEAGAARWLSTLNEARMMAIVRSSSEAIITIDEAQRIVIFNPMAERIFRCSAMDAIGESLDRFIPHRYREGHKKHVQQFSATGVSERQMGRQRVLTGLRADGEEFPVEASISQIADVDGQRKFYTVMLRDATERMKAENELKASREALRKLSANLQDVRENEKTRIARELHDDLGQQLTALKMDLSSLEQSIKGSSTAPPSVLVQLQGMRRLIDTTVGSVRRIAADLRPVMLDDLGLLPAIEWLINDFTARYGIAVERRIEPGTFDFSRGGATALFRIMQEALTNVVRHAQASHVTIRLAVEGEQCLLRIADDGRGATPDEIEGRGEKSFGLLGIRERAHKLGGSISIETAAQSGFILKVLLPLAAIQQEEALP